MCGIVGALSFSDHFTISEDYLTGMRDTMIHRGPDSGGIWISENRRAGLGHRRLSIIDLSEAATQPMTNEDGTLWVSFNGEIYNHAEIRLELESIGTHRWKTSHSDTEVILHAFEQWGINCLQRFRGMFAIAIWDGRNRQLWLIRDRIGVKPLYYSIHHGRITFASEIKALLSDPEQKRDVNPEAFYHYLSFLTTPAPQTLFDGIKKLPGGTWLMIDENGAIREERYWDVLDYTHPLTKVSENEISERIIHELRTSVKLRKVSDVPVGVFLSGGIDSSTNAALFSEGESGKVKTFTIGYRGEYSSYPNELEYARKMAREIHSEHHELLLTVDDLIDFLPRMVYLQDEPIADPVCVPVYYVSKLARDNGVIVCQVGEGADELFWGYPHWKVMLDLQRLSSLPVPRFLKQSGVVLLNLLNRQRNLYYELLQRSAAGRPVFWGGAEAFTEFQKQQLLSESFRQQFRNFSSWEAIAPLWRRYNAKAWEKRPLQWMSYLDLNLRLPELLLMRVDKMSMGVSLEGRVPFLDHKLAELAMSIPEAMKTKNGVLKYMLKKAVQGIIPDELITRKKQGFGVPVHEWFMECLGDKTRQELTEFCKQTNFFNRDTVLNMLDTGQAWQLWYLLNFALWWKKNIYS
jgi:asparagine synthase (glutamine-hydrolysing)